MEVKFLKRIQDKTRKLMYLQRTADRGTELGDVASGQLRLVDLAPKMDEDRMFGKI